MKKKNPVLLIVGILLLIAGTIFCFRFFQPDVENYLETDTGRYYAYSPVMRIDNMEMEAQKGVRWRARRHC